MNMKKFKEMFNNYIANREIKVDKEVIECIQEYINLGQKIDGNPNHGKEIKRRMRIG